MRKLCFYDVSAQPWTDRSVRWALMFARSFVGKSLELHPSFGVAKWYSVEQASWALEIIKPRADAQIKFGRYGFHPGHVPTELDQFPVLWGAVPDEVLQRAHQAAETVRRDLGRTKRATSRHNFLLNVGISPKGYAYATSIRGHLVMVDDTSTSLLDSIPDDDVMPLRWIPFFQYWEPVPWLEPGTRGLDLARKMNKRHSRALVDYWS